MMVAVIERALTGLDYLLEVKRDGGNGGGD
jgi:hypothetical protein